MNKQNCKGYAAKLYPPCQNCGSKLSRATRYTYRRRIASGRRMPKYGIACSSACFGRLKSAYHARQKVQS